MMTDEPAALARRLLGEAPCFSVLPAGVGKTEVLAHCCVVSAGSDRRSLVLTHTNAGVDVLRRRIASVGGDNRCAHVATIAGWSEFLCRMYPVLAEWSEPDADASIQVDYDSTYAGAASVLVAPAIQRMMRRTWSCVLVDEYQDCSKQQHGVIKAISKSIPTIVVGDHLQAIFGFEGTPINWADDVYASWPQVELPYEPRRWQGTNPTLGSQLLAIRDLLQSGAPIDVRDFSEIRWFRETQSSNVVRSKQAALKEGSCLVLVRFPSQVLSLAKKCDGRFGTLERLAVNDLVDLAGIVDSASPDEVLRRLFALAKNAMARLPSGFLDRGEQVASGEALAFKADSKLGPLTSAAKNYMESKDLAALSDVVAEIRRLDKVVIARKELWEDIELCLAGAQAARISATESAARIRERARRRGRRPATHVIGTTLLAKGLEFDHVVVTSAHEMTRENLYVALTRATTSLEVISEAPVLDPRWSVDQV